MIDLTFIFDSSNTNSRGDFERIKQFAISLTRELEVRPEKTRVSAISFHRDPTEEFFMMEFDEKEEVIEAIEVSDLTSTLHSVHSIYHTNSLYQ